MRLLGRLGAPLGRLFPPDRRRHALGMFVVLVTAFAIRARNIEGGLPYCAHGDESTWANIALRILRTGDPNPHRFRKPSLPVYVMTAGFSLGYLQAKWSGQIRHVEDLGTKVSPYYQVPTAARPTKLLFAFASILALGFAGVTGAALTGRAALLWLTPLFAAISSSYLRLSWEYLDVDVIGALFIWATLAYLAEARRRKLSLTSGPGALRRLVTLGVLAGFAVGSKYNLFPILVPCVLWFLLFERERWFQRSVLLGAISVLAFFVTTPYALITPGEFIQGVLLEVHHYATGHGGAATTPGLPMLWLHFQHFDRDFGLAPLLLSLAGVAFCFRRDARLSLLVFSYPLVFVSYMSLQRVFFERNVMAIHLHVGLALAALVTELPDWLAGTVRARWSELRPARVRAVGLAALAAVLLVGLPWSQLKAAYADEPDARNRATAWAARTLDKKQLVLVDPELKMDTRQLERYVRVEDADLRADTRHSRRLEKLEHGFWIFTNPEHQAAYSEVFRGLRLKARFEAPGDPSDVSLHTVLVLKR